MRTLIHDAVGAAGAFVQSSLMRILDIASADSRLPCTARTYENMLRPYIVYYRYKLPGEKKPGAVKQFRLYANNFEEARRLVAQQACYPDIDVLEIKIA